MESPLRKLRKDLDLTITEISHVSGASIGHISNCEAGHAHLGPKLEAFLRRIDRDVQEILRSHEKFMDGKKAEILRKARSGHVSRQR